MQSFTYYLKLQAERQGRDMTEIPEWVFKAYFNWDRKVKFAAAKLKAQEGQKNADDTLPPTVYPNKEE